MGAFVEWGQLECYHVWISKKHPGVLSGVTNALLYDLFCN
jgi:hypothetical protein